MVFALEALVYYIRPQSGPSYTLQSGMGLLTEGEEGLSQVLVSGASRPQGEAGDASRIMCQLDIGKTRNAIIMTIIGVLRLRRRTDGR